MSRSKMIAIIMGLCVIGDSMLYVTLPPSYQDLGLSSQLTGVILSANRFSRIVFNPFAALIVARLGYRRTAIVCSLMAISCTLGYSFVSHPLMWVVLRIMWGLTWSLIRLTAMLITLEDAGSTARGQALGFMQRLVRIGSVTGTFAGGLMLDRLGFRPTAMVLGLVTCASLALSLMLRPSNPVQGQTGQSAPPPPQVPVRVGLAGLRRGLREGISCLGCGWPVFASTLLAAVAVGGIFLSTVGLLLKTRLPADARVLILGVAVGAGSLSGFAQSFRWLSDILFAPAIGRMSDRYGRALPAAAVFGVQLVSALAILAIPNLYITVAAQAAMFMAQSFALVVLSTASTDLTRGKNASVPLTLYSTCLDLGDAAGPVVAYSLVDSGLATGYGVGTAIIAALAVVWGWRAVGSLVKTRTGHQAGSCQS